MAAKEEALVVVLALSLLAEGPAQAHWGVEVPATRQLVFDSAAVSLDMSRDGRSFEKSGHHGHRSGASSCRPYRVGRGPCRQVDVAPDAPHR